MWRDIASGDVVSWVVVMVSAVSRVTVSGGVVGCYEERIYGDDLICGVCRWSELVLLWKRTAKLRDWIFWKCVTR